MIHSDINARTSTEWKKLATSDKIRGRGGTPMVASSDGKAIYILGGYTGKFNKFKRFLEPIWVKKIG